MPTYEYECTDCGRKIKTDCAKCNNQAPVKRLIGTGAAVLFKGNGFYQTDYRSEAYKKSAKADTENGSKTASDDKKHDVKSTETAPAKDGGTADSPPLKSPATPSKTD